ncbi:MAG: right-handed parallel beta-helix repeat-containing protein [Planctomycetota bacterium]|jgi:preprotein translocase subunit YajC
MMRLCAKSFLLTFALECLAASVLQGAVFYVDPEKGDMDNDGSTQHPWKTVEQVFEQNLIQTRGTAGRLKNPQAPVKPGDTVLLRSGYHGQIYCRGAHNDDFITIAAEEGQKPKVRRIFFSAAKKWVIRGLTVSPGFAPEYKRDRLIYVVDWGGPSADFVIENNTLYSSEDASSWSAKQWDSLVCYGISVIGERIKIRNNTLRYVDHGIIISGDKFTVERNSIEHIAGDGIVCSADNASLLYNKIKYFYRVNDNHDDGIQFHRGRDKTTPILNAVVRGNSVIARDNTVSNPLIGHPQGICNFDIPAVNWRVENNLVLVQHHHGITIGGCQNSVIINNLAYNPYGGRFFAGIIIRLTITSW